ncbi:MAG: ABC transporter ATP-binding protein [Thermodesulfovibrio sp.]|nr:ABC transporter ATP-binding protein [Thermodesulfovibrio sp.]
MIVFDNICFSYGTRQVLKDISFSIESNERVAILGGSGEGKTTILKLIVGLIKPDSGRIGIDKVDITDKTEDELREVRKKFSIVFQEGALFDSLNVKENVAFCLREYTKMSEEEIEEKVGKLLRKVGVEQAMQLMPDELSGGMHRRVAVARSLAVYEPRMFLYDEPTAGLDPVNAENICNLIVDLSKGGIGHVVVTHKVVDALRVVDRFMFLQNGVMIFDGNSYGLMHSAIPEIQIFISELNFNSKENRQFV